MKKSQAASLFRVHKQASFAHVTKLWEGPISYTPALLVLQEKGYTFGRIPEPRIEQSRKWYAKKGSNVFVAQNPLDLLGVVTLHESVQT